MQRSKLMICVTILTLTGLGPAHAQGFPDIATALPCGTVGGAGVTAAGPRLFRVDIPTADYPEAVCNDGSPGVFYVLASPGGVDADKWHVHLQGGGACRTPESCAQRWCRADTNFGMDKMTSTLAPAVSAAGNGMFSSRVDNPLRDWNHVFMHYCSSDNWSGQAGDAQLTAELPAVGSVDFSMHFRGADIFDAVIDMLKQPGGTPVSYFDGAASQDMPDLDDAEIVLLSGASAGGGGVVRNLDRLAADLPATNNDCADGCEDLVLGVIDAVFAPDRIDLDATQTGACLDGGLCTYADFALMDWNEAMLGMWNNRTDESCRDWHQANEPANEWRCADHTYLIKNHLTTPFFLRFDLQDKLVGGNMASEIDPLTGERRGYRWRGMWTDPKVFGVLNWKQMHDVRSNWKTAPEGHPERAAPSLREPGVFAPQCNMHESLRNNPGFLGARATDADGVLRSMPELLMNWIAGTEPQVAIESLRGTGPLAHCP